MTTGDGPGAGRARGLRAGLVAVLAGSYLAALWAFSGRPPSHAAASAPTPDVEAPRASAGASAPSAPVWYQDLPSAQRPTVVLPAGWQIAQRAAPATGPSVRVAPAVTSTAPRARPARLRTRSS